MTNVELLAMGFKHRLPARGLVAATGLKVTPEQFQAAYQRAVMRMITRRKREELVFLDRAISGLSKPLNESLEETANRAKALLKGANE